MFAVLRSRLLSRHLYGIAYICLALTTWGCSGGGGHGTSIAGGNNNPMPAITSLAPASVVAGSAAQTLSINGSGFISGSSATYNGIAHTATFVSSAQLRIQLSAAEQATVGSYAVVVTNAPPGGGASNSANFAVTGANNPMPAITSLAPASVVASSAPKTLTINGSGFISSSTATYNGIAHTATFVNSAQLTIQLSAADQATVGSYAVVVTNAPPGGGASNSVNLAVTGANNPMPAITSLAPASVVAGLAAQTLTINGSGFISSSTATYNGIAHTATFVSSTQLTIQLSAADQATVGSYAVVVANAPPGGGTSNTATFTVSPATTNTPSTALVVGGQSTSAAVLKSAELFDSAAGTFTSTGNMLVARFQPTATPLTGGTAVLVTGGSDASGAAINTAEIYKVATKTFGATALAMKCAHKGHTATLLQSGKVLVAGRDGTTITACAELYDPSTGLFTRTTGDMTMALSNHAAVLLKDGRVLIVGGSVDAVSCPSCVPTNTAELYDPSTDMFTVTAYNSVIARSSPTATLLTNGEVLIAGGGATPTDGPLKTAELYDPSTDSFAYTGIMSIPRQFHTATLLNNGMVLVAGGLTKGQAAATSAELYDPTTGTFKANGTGSMSTAREFHTATLLGNGFVLVAGGMNTVVVNTADLYDPTTGLFGQTGSMTTARYGAAAVPMQ